MVVGEINMHSRVKNDEVDE